MNISTDIVVDQDNMGNSSLVSATNPRNVVEPHSECNDGVFHSDIGTDVENPSEDKQLTAVYYGLPEELSLALPMDNDASEEVVPVVALIVVDTSSHFDSPSNHNALVQSVEDALPAGLVFEKCEEVQTAPQVSRARPQQMVPLHLGHELHLRLIRSRATMLILCGCKLQILRLSFLPHQYWSLLSPMVASFGSENFYRRQQRKLHVFFWQNMGTTGLAVFSLRCLVVLSVANSFIATLLHISDKAQCSAPVWGYIEDRGASVKARFLDFSMGMLVSVMTWVIVIYTLLCSELAHHMMHLRLDAMATGVVRVKASLQEHGAAQLDNSNTLLISRFFNCKFSYFEKAFVNGAASQPKLQNPGLSGVSFLSLPTQY